MTGDRAPDLLVVGAGLAGLASGVRAGELGLKATVLEASSEALHLFNSRFTGGLFHIAMDDMAAEPAKVAENLRRATGGAMDVRLARTLATNARRTLGWLERQGVRLIKAGPDGLRRHALAPPGVRQTGLNWRGRSGDVMLRTLERRLTALATGAR